MIAYRPFGKGGRIPNAVIDTAIQRHSDGFGIMWRDESGLHTGSWAPKQRKQFRKALKACDAAGVEYAAHFRFATSGPTNVEMAHPYTYEDPDPAVGTVALMHNGIIDIAHDKAKESDTSAFVRLVLASLPSRWWANPAINYLVNEAIGWSKLTIMTATETFNMHDKRGEWDDGLWYSSSHRPAEKAKFLEYLGADETWVNGYTDKDGAYHAGYLVSGLSGRTTSGKGASSDKTEHTYERGGRIVAGHWDGTLNKWVEADKGPAPERMPKPYALPAVKSAVALGLLTPTAGLIETTGESDTRDPDEAIRMVDRPYQFTHAGHTLTALVDMALDGDDREYEDAVICDTCRTSGTVYVLEGNYYIDMSHIIGSDNDDEEWMLPSPVAVTATVRA